VEAANGGIDTVEALDINFSIANLGTIENLRVVGLNTAGTGNTLANKITGGSSFNFLFGLDGNDTLDGGAGPDQMSGGFGNDTFLVNDAGDVVLDGIGQGRDTVFASTSYTLTGGQEIEVLVLTGSAGLQAFGNQFANTLTGNSGANLLQGGGGDDVMGGGKGGDLYIVEDAGDKVVEAANAGNDQVGSSLLNYTLAANVEFLFLSDGGVNGTGNGLANTIAGNAVDNSVNGAAGNDALFGAAGNDILIGGAGDDILEGGLGVDTLIGDAGKDTFAYGLTSPVDLALLGGDIINGFTKGIDKIDIGGLLGGLNIDPALAFDEFVQLSKSGNNTLISIDADGGSNPVLLATVTNVTLAESDFVLS